MKSWRVFLVVLSVFFVAEAHAVTTEVGVNYGRKRTSFDADNTLDSESVTASVSLYFLERLALELSWTQALAVREEKTPVSRTTVVQTTTVYGADLIWVFADRKDFFQPYIKGGGAQIRRVQEVKNHTLSQTYTVDPEVATVPSYGVGFKIAVTEALGLKISYDGWKTPVGGGSFSNDDSLRAGVTWLF